MMANCWKRNGKLWKSDGEQCRRWGTTQHQGWMAKLAENFSGVVSRPNAFMGPGSGARFLQKIRRRWGVTQQHARSECKTGRKLVWCWVASKRRPGSKAQSLPKIAGVGARPNSTQDRAAKLAEIWSGVGPRPNAGKGPRRNRCQQISGVGARPNSSRRDQMAKLAENLPGAGLCPIASQGPSRNCCQNFAGAS